MEVALVPTSFQAQGPVLLEHLRRLQRGEMQPSQSPRQLRQHQIDAALQLEKYFNPEDRSINPNSETIALVVLPTGCGKTGVAVLASYILSPKRVLVITPSVIISEQIDDAYKHFLVKCGIITEDQKKTNGALPSIETIRSTSQMFHEPCHEPTTNVVVVNPHKIGGQSKVPIDMINPDDYDLVIVDEAHHYPAQTWSRIVDHFPRCKRLFLTATPCHNGKPLDITPCFTLGYENAVKDCTIRGLDDLCEVPPHDEKNLDEIYKLVAKGVENHLDRHDKEDDRVEHKHQGMVLAQTKERAEKFCSIYNDCGDHKCALYVGNSPKDVLQQFVSGQIRILVVVGRLQEGFDHNKVSVVGIIRKVKSPVLFTQFVGRAVRKSAIDDRVKAQIVTHRYFDQQSNYDMFDKHATRDPEPEDVENPSDFSGYNFMEAISNPEQ